MGMVKEFREFALKGNVIDLAVGIIIGAAFGKIVASLVNDVLMPPLGLLIGGIDFSQQKFMLREGTVDAAGAPLVKATEMRYGLFLNEVVTFAIVAFAVFLLVKTINTLRRRFEAPPPPPLAAGPTREEVLLTEIRDSLRNR